MNGATYALEQRFSEVEVRLGELEGLISECEACLLDFEAGKIDFAELQFEHCSLVTKFLALRHCANAETLENGR